jgi:hypothetical protein
MIKHILTALLLATGINVLNASTNANVNANPDVNPDTNDSVITNIVGSINAVSGTVDSLTQDSIRTERAESREEAEKIEEAESKEKAESIEKANADFAARQQRLSYLRQVYDKAVYVQNISSKISLGIQGMGKDVTLDGKLQMRKGQVIRLTIVPFGLMEVARLEFTPTYVLLIDRIHKEYVKASYNEVEFLKTEGLTFYTLQSLFWNELFQPGKARLAEGDLSLYTTDDLSNGGKKINFQHENMSFSWIIDSRAFIKATDISYAAGTKLASNVKVSYDNFTPVGVKSFPKQERITFNTKAFSTGTMSLDINMGNISTDANWDATTNISSNYKQISAEEFFERLSKL